MPELFLKSSKFFLYASALSVLIVASSMFFPFIVGKDLFFRTTIELGLLSLALALLWKTGPEQLANLRYIIKHPLAITIAVFTALFVLSSFTAVNKTIAFWSNFERGEGAVQMIHYALFFGLAAFLIKTQKEWRRFISWLAAIGFFVALYAVGQRFGWSWAFGPSTRVSGTLGNPLYLSTFLLFQFFFLSFLIGKQKNKLIKTFLSGVFVFELVVFIMTDSRNGFAGLAGGIIAFLLYLVINGRQSQFLSKFNLRKSAAAALACLLLFGGIFYFTRTEEFWQSVPGLRRFARERVLTGLDDRLWVWGAALSGFIEKPVFGWGPENFPILFDKYYNPKHYGLDSWFDRAHNIYLEYLTAGGIILFLAYFAVWAAYFYTLAKILKKSGEPVFGALLIAMPVAYFIQGLTAFEVLPIYVILYAYFAFTVRLRQQTEAEFIVQKAEHKPKQPPQYFSLHPFFYAVSAAILAGAVSFSLYFTVYLPFKKNRLLLSAASSNANPQRAYDTFQKALAFYSPIGQQETVQQYQSFILQFLRAVSENSKTKVEPQNVRALVQEAETAYAKNENSRFRAIGTRTLYVNASLYLQAAITAQNVDLLSVAKKKFEEGLKTAPTRFEFIYPLLDIAAIKGDKETGKTLLARAQFLRPDLSERNQYYKKKLGL